MDRPLVLVAVPFYPDSKNLFHGRFFQERARALSEFARVRVIHIALRNRFKDGPGAQSEEDSGPSFQEIRVQKALPSLRFEGINDRVRQAAAGGALRRIIHKDGRPDFLFAETGFPTGALVAALSAESGIPYGICDHYSFTPAMLRDHRKQLSTVYGPAAFRAAVSPVLQRVVRIGTDFRWPVEVLPNCLSPDLEQRPLAPPPDTAAFRWIFVGRDHPVKNPALLFEAFSKLDDRHTLTVAGLGDGERFVKDLDSGVRSRIQFVPNQPAGALWNLMEQHHALVCTSLTETFGMAVLEMLALGRMAVTTPCGGPEGFVDDRNGAVATGFSAGDLVSAMNAVYERFSGASLAANAAHVRERFSGNAFARTFLRLSNLSDS